MLDGIIFLVNNEISNYNEVDISLNCDEDILFFVMIYILRKWFII